MVLRVWLRRLFALALNILFSNDPRKIKQVFLKKRTQFIWSREHVGRKIALRLFERRETRFFLDFIRQGDVCLDVGANVGYYTNLFASCVAPGGSVISIEPVYRNTMLINLASAINNTRSIVTVICAAVSDRDGRVKISRDFDSSYASVSVSASSLDSEIAGITLDSVFHQYDLPRIDVVKMDIEGWEYHALEGMKGVLSRNEVRPKLMMIELYTDHLKRYGSSIEQVCTFLGHYGYQPHVLGSRGRLVPFQKSHHNKIYNVFFLGQEQRR